MHTTGIMLKQNALFLSGPKCSLSVPYSVEIYLMQNIVLTISESTVRICNQFLNTVFVLHDADF
jgi:hypothetical protein